MSDLLQRVRSLTQQQAAQLSQQAAAVAVTGDAQAVPPAGKLANVVDEALSRLSSLSVASGSESGGDGCDDGGNPTASQAQQEAVGVLRELCALQGTCDTFLLHVLVGEGGGNVEVRGPRLEAAAAAELRVEALCTAPPLAEARTVLVVRVCPSPRPTGRSGMAARVPRPSSSPTRMAAGAAATAAGAGAGGSRAAGGEKGDSAALPAAGGAPSCGVALVQQRCRHA